ncbi:response regulator transcription factor [Anaerotalea alkaliphila]|nr:response regulator [Anaerotalea alkaliphila]
MLTVLIVDDDMLVRQTLRALVDWDKLGFAIAGEAGDGLEAIEEIDKTPPDLLILDMSMPQMDGLEVIRHIRQKGLDTRILVLSCHDDFHYVKEAMRLRADEYLLKHILSPEGLEETVLKLREQILADAKLKVDEIAVQRRSREGMRLLRNELLAKILRGPVFFTEIEEKIKAYAPDLAQAKFAVAHIRIRNFQEAVKSFEPDGEDILRMVLGNIVEEVGKDSFPAELVQLEQGEFALLVRMAATSRARVKTDMEALTKRIEYAMHTFFNIRMNAVVSTDCATYRGLGEIYRRVRQTGKHFFYEDAVLLADGQLAPIGETALPQAPALLDRVKSQLEENGFEDMLEEMQETHRRMADARPDPDAFMDWYAEMNRSLLNYVAYRFKLRLDQDKKDDFVEGCRKADNEKELFQCFKGMVAFLESLLASDSYKDVENRHIREALRYIQAHFMEDLSLSTVAEHLHVNGAYLSHLFKEFTGQNFVDHVKEVRIKKACEHLDHSDMKIKDVGEAVGIPNRKYFSKSFKKLVGMSPQEYKGRALK